MSNLEVEAARERYRQAFADFTSQPVRGGMVQGLVNDHSGEYLRSFEALMAAKKAAGE